MSSGVILMSENKSEEGLFRETLQVSLDNPCGQVEWFRLARIKEQFNSHDIVG